MLIDGEEETRSVLRLGDNPVPAVDQKARDARPQQSGVLGDHDPQRGFSGEFVHALSPVDPHGSSACTRVGPPLGTLDEESTVEGGHPVGEPPESRAGGVGPAFAIVFDLHYQEIRFRTVPFVETFLAAYPDVDPGSFGVPGSIREGFGDDEVCGDLHGLRRTFVEMYIHGNGDRGSGPQARR